MRHGLFEMQILDKNNAVLPERCIDGRVYVEARPGEEFRIRIAIHKNDVGKFPVKSCLAKLYADGQCAGEHGFLVLEENVANRVSYTYVAFPNGLPNNHQVLEFAAAPTSSDFKEEDESATGELMFKFFEAERSSGSGRPKQSPQTFPKPENNKPYKQPSLMIQSGRVVKSVARPLQNWIILSDEPDAVLRVKCHTKASIDFLQFRHEQQQRARALAASYKSCTVDLTDDAKEPEAAILTRDTSAISAISSTATSAGIPSATAFDFAMPAGSLAAPTSSSSSTAARAGIPPNTAFDFAMPAASPAATTSSFSSTAARAGIPPTTTLNFAMPAGSSAAAKPPLRLKNRANKTTRARVEAAAVHTAGAKRKVDDVSQSTSD